MANCHLLRLSGPSEVRKHDAVCNGPETESMALKWTLCLFQLVALFEVQRGMTDSPRESISNGDSSDAPSPEPLSYYSYTQLQEPIRGEIEVNEAVLKASKSQNVQLYSHLHNFVDFHEVFHAAYLKFQVAESIYAFITQLIKLRKILTKQLLACCKKSILHIQMQSPCVCDILHLLRWPDRDLYICPHTLTSCPQSAVISSVCYPLCYSACTTCRPANHPAS